MSIIATGRMRKRVEIQKAGEARDAEGGFTSVAFVTENAVWAHINPLSAMERVQGDQVKAIRSHRITTRFYSPGATSADRIKMGTRIFDIVSIVDPGERGCNTIFDVKEAEVRDD